MMIKADFSCVTENLYLTNIGIYSSISHMCLNTFYVLQIYNDFVTSVILKTRISKHFRDILGQVLHLCNILLFVCNLICHYHHNAFITYFFNIYDMFLYFLLLGIELFYSNSTLSKTKSFCKSYKIGDNIRSTFARFFSIRKLLLYCINRSRLNR